jgi:hypothetical protein
MGGIIMGAIGGLGDAAANVGSTMLKNELDTESRLKIGQQDSDLALQRAKALEDYKVHTANSQREQQVARVSSAAQPILEQGIVNRARSARANQLPDYDPSDTTGPASFHGDAKQILASIQALPDGPDKQAALTQLQRQVDAGVVKNASLRPGDLTDEERARFAPSDDEQIKARTKAAIQTGDISPEKAATILQKDDALLYRTLYEQMKEEGRNNRADARVQAQMDMADKRLEYLLASLEKRGAGNPTKEALAFLDGSRKEVAEQAQSLKSQYQAELKAALLPDDKARITAEYKPKFEDVDRRRKMIESDYASMRERVGLPPIGDSPAPAPASRPTAAPPGLPPGARQIGTSGGKPVFQLPDGSQIIQQ